MSIKSQLSPAVGVVVGVVVVKLMRRRCRDRSGERRVNAGRVEVEEPRGCLSTKFRVQEKLKKNKNYRSPKQTQKIV